jgi:glycine cleavage system regulatory protein
MRQQFIITFIGDDRTGLVEHIARCVNDQGGNWLDSQLSKLGGKFAGLVLVEIDPAAEGPLSDALQTLDGHPFSVRVTPAGRGEAQDADLTLTVTGPDRPGIVREVSSALARHGINVVRLDSRVFGAPFTGEAMFEARVQASLPAELDRLSLDDALDEIADRLTLEIDR